MQPRQRKPPRRLLEESEQRYRSLYEHHPDAIFLLSTVPRLLSANPAAERISGYTLPELAKVSVADLMEPDSLPLVLQLYRRCLEGKAGSEEVAIRDRAGRRIDLRLTLVPTFVAGRIEGVYGIAQDISERRRVEREHAAVLARALAAEQRAALLAEVSAALAGSLDYEQTLSTLAQLLVPAFADWCAVDVQAENGQVRRVVGAVSPAVQERMSGALPGFPGTSILQDRQRVALRGLATRYLPEITDEMLRAFATSEQQLTHLRELKPSSLIRVPLEARGSLIGTVSFVCAGSDHHFSEADLALAREIARRAAVAIDIARLYREAQTAVQVRDQFLASASHDLRTPVTTIKALAQLLERRVPAESPSGEKLSDGLRTIDETADRITALINELLDLSRLQSGRPLELARRPCDLVDLVRRAAAANQHINAGRHVRIETDLPSLTGFWDPQRLQRVLDNLLSNALKYSAAGEVVTITVARELGAVGPHSDIAVLTVHDGGIGIPPPDLPHIFERFYRAANVGDRSGAGIGLAGAREIVLQHGGSIDVRSEEGAGSTFSVRLPLSPPDEAPELE